MSLASWLRILKARFQRRTTQRSRPTGRRRYSAALALERLEDRTVPSAYWVTTTADGGPGSLRDAIYQVNADTSHTLYPSPSNPSMDEIDFRITADSDTGGGYNAVTKVATITPLAGLPDITNAVLINGYTQPEAKTNDLSGPGQLGVAPADPSTYGDDAVLKIELDGASAGTATGLYLAASNVTVQGLVINRFSHYGIRIGGTGDVIQGNFLGTDVTGTQAFGNSEADVKDSATNAVIGGTTPMARNIISGQLHGTDQFQGGIVLFGADNSTVQGNFIGTDSTGTRSLGNADQGISILTNNCLIGGPTPGAGNIISGNGLGIFDNGDAGTLIQGNYIGTDITGTKAVGNGDGVWLWSDGSGIGGTAPGAGNVISGNGIGIRIWRNNHRIEGNLIGTDSTGTNPIANGTGIYMSDLGDSNVVIGGLDTNAPGAPLAGGGNLISSNTNGILMLNGSGNVVEGNYIGTDITGTTTTGSAGATLGNYVDVLISASNNMLGGTAAGSGNIIAGSRVADGVSVAAGATGVSILGNSIHDNPGGLGIFLASGANDNQAAPVLTSATSSSTDTTISGTLASTPGTTFRIEFFANPSPDPSGYGEGQTYLGFATVTTDRNGNATFTATGLAPVPAGQAVLSATLTDLTNNDTSGFSHDGVLAVTALASSANPSVYGQPVTLTASVSGYSAGFDTPTGSVHFVDTTTNTDLGTVAVSGGRATLTTSVLAAGSHDIEAVYGGDSTFLGNSTTLVQVVNKADAAITIIPYSGTYDGQAHGLTGTATGTFGEDLSGLLSLGASYTNAGSYPVGWSFAGNANYNAVSGTGTVAIAQAKPEFSAVGTTVIMDGAPSVTLSGTLTYGSLIPAGNVTVTVDNNSQTVPIGAGGNFSATFATSSLSVGAHAVIFSYAGDQNYTATSANGSLDDSYKVLALFDQTHAKHPGNTLAIQIALATASNQDVSSTGVTVSALGIAATTDTTDLVGATDSSNVGTLLPAQEAGGSNPNNVFHYQGGAKPFYQYNLKIPAGLAAGTYRLYFAVEGDPLDHWVTFTVG